MAGKDDNGEGTPLEEAAELLKGIRQEISELDKMIVSTAKTAVESGSEEVTSTGETYVRTVLKERRDSGEDDPLEGVYDALLDAIPERKGGR